MEPDHLRTLARMEHARLAWEYAVQEAELHQHRLVQGVAVFLAAGLAALGSIFLQKVPPTPALAFALAMFESAGYAQFQIALLPARLAGALRAGQGTMQRLIRRGGR